MVRVHGCHLFQSQEVFTTTYKPSALCASENQLFLATQQCFIHVYSLSQEGCPEVTRFPTVSPSKQILHDPIANTVISLENDHGTIHVRLYQGWERDHGETTACFVGYRSTKFHPYQQKDGRMEVVEISLHHSPTSINLHAPSRTLAIAFGHKVSLYENKSTTDADGQNVNLLYQNQLDLQFSFKVENVVLYEDFVAVSSRNEVQVIQLFKQAHHTQPQQSSLTKHVTAEGKTGMLDSESTNISQSRAGIRATGGQDVTSMDDKTGNESHHQDEADDQSVVSKHPNCLTLTPELIFQNNIQPSNVLSSRPTSLKKIYLKGLHSCKFGNLKTQDTNSPREVVRPERARRLSPELSPQSADCEQTETKTILYCMLSEEEAGVHSLQFVPVKLEDKEGDLLDPGCKSVSSLSLFFSTARKGYMYQISQETSLLTTYPYTKDCTMVSVHPLFVHAVTGAGLETYSSRAVTAAIHDTTSINNFSKAFPPVDTETSLLSIQPFIGASSVRCTDSHVILLSMADDTTANSGEDVMWSIYCLSRCDVHHLYMEMMEQSERFREFSSLGVLHILQEINHFLWASKLLKIPTGTSTDSLLRESASALAVHYSNCGKTDHHLCLPYYLMSDLTPENMLTQMKTTELGAGFLHWLNHHVLQTGKIPGNQEDEERIFEMLKLCPDDLPGPLGKLLSS